MIVSWKIKIERNINTVLLLLSIIVILYYFLPIISGYITAFMMMVILFFAYFIILLTSKWCIKKVFLHNCMLMLSLIVLFFVRGYYKRGLIGVYSIFLVFFPAFITVFLYHKKQYVYLKILASVAIISLIITSITTYIGLSFYPDMARTLAAISDSNSNILQISIDMNIGGFEIIYSSILCLPIYFLVCNKLVKNTLLNKVIKVCICVLECLLAVKTQYTTALLLVVFSIILIVTLRKFNFIRVCILCGILILIFMYSTDHVIAILNHTAEQLDNTAIAERMIELSNSLSGGEATGDDITARSDAYYKSIDTFLNYPVLGAWYMNGSEGIGGHSTFLDLLAAGGILSFICFIYTIIIIIRSIIFPIENAKIKKYICIFLINFIVLAFLNPLFSGIFFTVLFIIPTGLIRDNKENKSGGI